MSAVISVENLSKAYLLGQIGTGTLTNDLRLWWAKKRGRPNPFLRIGEKDHANRDGETIWALKDVSFAVEQAEVLGIIGRNGAGKSTLLKILSQVTAPTSGLVRVKGRIASLLEVGTGFHPDLTGRENVYLNGAILGMNRNEVRSKFDEIVDFAGVEKFIDTPVKRYSSGMYVRLAFAVAAHLEPEILLVDEVLAVGDAAFQKKCLNKMGSVSREGRTVLFVSHNMGAIAELCSKCIVMKSGRVSDIGLPRDMIAGYLRNDYQENKASIDLRSWHQDRIGNGPMRIRSVETLDKSGELCAYFEYGDPVSIRVGIDASPGSKFTLGISVRNDQGQLLHHLNSVDDCNPFIARSDFPFVIADITKNYLNDGDYYISVYLGDSYRMLNDRVGNCLSFAVTNKTLGQIQNKGLVIVPVAWRVGNDNMNRMSLQ
jgi:lipopolysaccharide transport system ATP-binding protein